MLIKSTILSFFILSCIATGYARVELASAQYQQQDRSQEMLYLPSGAGLHFISFGYSNALSQLLWFNTISYFGKHFRQDQNYLWLGHMCKLVTSLNPQSKHFYEFCSMMIAWEANQPEESIRLLTQAIQQYPRDWYFHYLRGFIYSYFLNKQLEAKEDFVAASKLPNAHRTVVRLAAKQLASLESPETAVEFLEDLLRAAQDPSMRAALSSRLEQIRNGTLSLKLPARKKTPSSIPVEQNEAEQ